MSTDAATLDQDVWRPKYNPCLIAVVVALAAFIEVLDTSIANVALPYMAGGISPADAQKQAHARIYDLVQLHAASLAYVDTFMVLAIISGIMFFLAFLLKKNDPHTGGHVPLSEIDNR